MIAQYDVQYSEPVVTPEEEASESDALPMDSDSTVRTEPGREAESGPVGGTASAEVREIRKALNRVPTDAEIMEHAPYGMEHYSSAEFDLRGEMLMNGLMESMGADDQPWLQCSIGTRLVSRGDLERGESYLRASLVEGMKFGHVREKALAVLAWLEPDTERATLLLEVALRDGNHSYMSLLDAIELCELTGSEELAARHQSLFDQKYPDTESKVSQIEVVVP